MAAQQKETYKGLNDYTEAERSFLCLLFENSGNYGHSLIADFYDPTIGDFFGQRSNQLIFTAMLEVHASGAPIDMINITQKLKDKGELEAVGGIAEISAIQNLDYQRQTRGEQLSLAESRLQMIKKSFLKRQVYAFCQMIGNMVHGDAREPNEILEFIVGETEKLDVLREAINAEAVDEFDMFDQWLKDTTRLNERPDEVLIKTGFNKFDQLYLGGGMMKGDYHLLAARPGMGKTTLACNIAVNACKNGKKVLFFSLEMSKKQILDRICARETGIDYEICRRPTLGSQDEQSKVFEEQVKIKEWLFSIIDEGRMTVEQMLAICRRFKRLKGGLDLVIIDHLQIVEASNRNENRTQEVSQISQKCKRMAKDLDVAVLALSQLNRSVENRKIKKPMMSDLRESGSLEQDADFVFFLFRQGYYDSKCEHPNLTEFIVAKNRTNGTIGTAEFNFDGPRLNFTEKSISFVGKEVRRAPHATVNSEFDIPLGLEDVPKTLL